jgi:signal transduction histidine kinase
MVRDLRPAQLDDLGLAPALEYLTDEIRKQMGLDLQFKTNGTRYRLDALIETVFFRVAQEALSNVVRHAGVTQAEVELLYAPDQVTLRVSDQGKGFDPKARRTPPQGWGIAGMSERAESVGGTLLIQSAPGRGTLVQLSVPVPGPLETHTRPAISLFSGYGHLNN